MRRIRRSKNKTKILGITLAMIGTMIIVRIIPIGVWYTLLLLMVAVLILLFFWGIRG